MSKQTASLNEPPEELARLREDLIAFYRPVSSQERFAIERIALAQQSMRRAARLETSLFAAPDAELLNILGSDAFKFFLRYQEQAERAYRRAVDEFFFLKAHRSPVPAVPNPTQPTLKPQAVPSPAAIPAAPSSPPRAPASIPVSASAASSAAAPTNLALRL